MFRKHILILTILSLHFIFLAMILFSPSFLIPEKRKSPLKITTIQKQPVFAYSTPPAPKMEPVPKTPDPTPPREHTPPAPQTPPAPRPAAPQIPPEHTPPAPTPPPVPKTPAPPQSKPTLPKEPAISDKTPARKAAKAPPAKKTERAKISDSLLKELAESIAKIDQPQSPPPAAKKGSKPITPLSLQIDIPSMSDTATDYTSTLIHMLHQTLTLPEFGDVKIQLTLREDGSIAKIVVLKHTSELNKKYLESHLSPLKFPPFQGKFAQTKERVFVLTFCNE